MLNSRNKSELEHQGYRFVGKHSAVKTCGWTRNIINDKGACYKHTFYGINSQQCLQMTTALSCANRCVFCWRGYKAPVSKEWKGAVDDPEFILNKAIEEHHHLLVGFKGSSVANKKVYQESQTVKHVALSLTGEPIIYPKINELIDLFHKNKISTFLVTNAQYPEQIKNLHPVTQLYLSLDAPTKELLKKVDKPLFSDYWERTNQSLEYLAQKKQRTCIRMTLVRSLNDVLPEKYAELVNKGQPDFIEVKAYMHLGYSRERLTQENMPLHEDIVKFSKELVQFLPEYEIVSEHVPSRVIMIAKKEFKKKNVWHTWIDFDKFFELVNSGKEFSTKDYLKKTPETGLSGKGTLDTMSEAVKQKFLNQN